jgi:hypothetical protein
MSAQLLEECRRRFGPPPRSFPSGQQHYLTIRPPAWCRLRMDPLMRLYKNQDRIRQQGRVVWGHLVQANQLLFQPGSDDCPASVIYSFDPWFDDHLDQLRDIAERLFELKDKQSTDPLAAQIGSYLAAETQRQFNLPVPRHWTEGRQVFIGDIMVPRKHLPAGYLVQSFFPLVIDADPSHGMLIVPAQYWDETLLTLWNGGSPQSQPIEYVPSATSHQGMSLSAKVLLGVLGGMLVMSFLCAGLVGGMLTFFGGNRQANRPWNGPAGRPAVQPWQAPAIPPIGGQQQLQRMSEQQRERLDEMQRQMQADAERRQQEMHERMQESLQRQRQFMERQP